MKSTLQNLHCNPVGIAITSQKRNEIKDPAPHRGENRAFDCVEGFVSIPAPSDRGNHGKSDG